MVKIEHGETYGWEAAIRGMRNPMNSWENSDSSFYKNASGTGYSCNVIGEKDKKLMKSLIEAGPDHAKFLRQIGISMDVTGPLYWWKEFDTYKVGTVANSCSTMHTIHKKPFDISDFSVEHLSVEYVGAHVSSQYTMNQIIETLEVLRLKYLESGDKRYWQQIIQLLPSSYNQKRTITMNYAVARNIYHARKNHKLTEWQEFCANLEALPESWLVTMEV